MVVHFKWLVLLIILSLIIGLGIYYLGYKPDIARFTISADIAKTTHKVGEKITFEPYLIYQGSLPLLPVKIRSAAPLFFYLVDDSEGNLLDLPYYIRVDIIVLIFYTPVLSIVMEVSAGSFLKNKI